MFRIRRIQDTTSPKNAAAIQRVQEIMGTQIAKTPPEFIAGVPDMLTNPLKLRFNAILSVAEDAHDRVKGFALLLYAPDLKFCFLEMIATAPGMTTGGIGGALYGQVRQEAVARGARGLFFECLTDNPAFATTPEAMRQNTSRLRFYERFGAVPIANTLYEEPLGPDDKSPLFLMYDPLDGARPLGCARARDVVRAILERKYGALISPARIGEIVASFRDDPVVLRAPRYVAGVRDALRPIAPAGVSGGAGVPIYLVVSERHTIHHVRDQAYVEAPVRIRSIMPEIKRSGLFRQTEPKPYPERHIRAVRDGAFVDYLRRASAQVSPGKSIYPQVFPVRNRARPPRELPLRAGYCRSRPRRPAPGFRAACAARASPCGRWRRVPSAPGRRSRAGPQCQPSCATTSPIRSRARSSNRSPLPARTASSPA